MAKSKNKKVQKKKLDRRILVILIIGGIFLAYFAYGIVRTQIDKRHFNKIEKDIMQVVIKLEDKYIQSENSLEKYCKRDLMKYGGGNLNCNILISGNTFDSNVKLSAQYQGIQQTLEANNFKPETELLGEGAVKTSQFIHTPTDTRCFLEIKEITNKYNTIAVKFYCVKAVYRPIYPEV